MFFQNTSAVSSEIWAAIAAIAGVLAVALKKLHVLKFRPKPEHITRAEFRRELSALHDRIAAGYLALADKMDIRDKGLVAALNQQATRINELETLLARVDERTHK